MNKLLVSPSPHIHSDVSTGSIMRDVVIALMPAVIVSILVYGWRELMVLGVSVASCVVFEYLITRYLFKKESTTIGDLSAVVTGILLGMNLPFTSPWWIVCIGALFAIGVVKMSFGGLGQNVFNPAIAARVFLLISFPVAMTRWEAPQGVFALDAYSGPTPLGAIKEGLMNGSTVQDILGEGFRYTQMLFAGIGGSAGEVSALALLLGFVYLLVRRVIRPHITLSIWLTVFVFSGIMWLCDPSRFTDPVFNLLTGGMILGSCFMATDYVTSPMSVKGGIIYGIGIGLLTMLIRYFGSYPEGMSFAILLMNITVPLLNRAFHQKKYGRA